MPRIKKEDRKYGHCIYCGSKLGTRRLVDTKIHNPHGLAHLRNPPVEQWCGVMKGICYIWTKEAEERGKRISKFVEEIKNKPLWNPINLSEHKMGVLTGYTSELA